MKNCAAGEPSPTDAQIDQWLAELVDLDKPAARPVRAEALAEKHGAIHVQWRGRAIRNPIERTARVLLIEFAERFDRTFLPVADVSLP